MNHDHTNQDPWTPIRPLPHSGSLPREYPSSGEGSGVRVAPIRQGEGEWDGESESIAESTLYDYWVIVFKYRYLILGSTFSITLLALLYAFLVTPLYTATSRIRIGTYEPVLAATSVEGIYQEQSKEANYLGTQIEQITSFTVGDRVLREERVRASFQSEGGVSFWSALFGRGGHDSEEGAKVGEPASVYAHNVKLIRSYLSSIKVTPVRRTSLVEIHATSPDPIVSSLMANAHAREYREWLRESNVQQRADTLEFLREQADELRGKVSSLEREIADYAEQHSIVAVNSDENITAQRMSQLSQLLTEVTANRIEAENIYEKAKDLNADNSAAYDDSTILTMRSELGRLKGEHGLLLEKFTPQYPKVRQLAAQIKQLEKGIVEQREQIISGLHSKAKALQLEEERLKEELEQQKSRTFELAKKQVQYNVLVRELESSRELLQNVLKQSKESALAIEGNSSNVTLVDQAIVPDAPSYPRKGLLLIAGLGLGMGVGLGLAFLLNHLDNTIRTPELLLQVTGLPNLGMVPSFELDTVLPESTPRLGHLASGAEALSEESGDVESTDRSSSGGASSNEGGAILPSLRQDAGYLPQPIAFLSDPRSLASEAYRTIRTGILLSQAGEPPRTILVTSSHSSEGKTTSAMNLAASLSSAGSRVIILDCDLRRPSLMRYFDRSVLIEERREQGRSAGLDLPGVVEVLTGMSNLDAVKIEGLIKSVTIIPAGSIPPNPAELIGSQQMKEFIGRLRAEYDFVIIDSPPILPVTDSVVLSRYVDGVVLVVKGGATPRRLVKDAVHRLRSVGTRILGTILNDIDLHGADYHYYNRYYTSYYDDERVSSPGRSGGEQRASGM